MTPPQRREIDVAARKVHRMAVDTSFAVFRARFEQAVPRFDAPAFTQLTRAEASWEALVRAVTDKAPHGFVTHWSGDISSMVCPEGNCRRCRAYLLDSPPVLFRAPLRAAIHEDAAGQVRFVTDRPSARLASLGDPRIARFGEDLDHKLDALLEFLGVTATPT
ncbi:hypothetical protein ACQPWY_30610 [Pseudonocardia xinjiangensis]|uniref:hypothetical protein n=1 Tax=Pseudonocardia xinjiangensis TaxID=75289 RepID=UPI003D8B8927